MLPDSTRTHLSEARAIYDEILDVENAIRRDYDRLLIAGWKLGGALAKLKAEVGHGRWLFWLGANWSDLGEDKAQRCMQFFATNASLSNPANLRDFDTDSIRRFLGGYLPAKIRPQLEGDKRLAPIASFDSVTNKFAALMHRIKHQHATPAPLDEVAPKFRMIVDGLRELYGRDSIDALLA